MVPDGIDYLINMAGRLVGTLLRTSFLMLYPHSSSCLLKTHTHYGLDVLASSYQL